MDEVLNTSKMAQMNQTFISISKCLVVHTIFQVQANCPTCLYLENESEKYMFFYKHIVFFYLRFDMLRFFNKVEKYT